MKKFSKKRLAKLEREMLDPARWEDANHTVSFKGVTGIRFSGKILKKLHAIAKARHQTIHRLVNDYVKPFVEGEYSLLENLK